MNLIYLKALLASTHTFTFTNLPIRNVPTGKNKYLFFRYLTLVCVWNSSLSIFTYENPGNLLKQGHHKISVMKFNTATWHLLVFLNERTLISFFHHLTNHPLDMFCVKHASSDFLYLSIGSAEFPRGQRGEISCRTANQLK